MSNMFPRASSFFPSFPLSLVWVVRPFHTIFCPAHSITPQISITLGVVTKQYVQNALCKSNALNLPLLILSLSRRLVHTACKITSVSCINLQSGVQGSEVIRLVALNDCRFFKFDSFVHLAIWVDSHQPSLWSDSSKGPPHIPETLPTHKRRQKSFGADSREVVTTGTSLQASENKTKKSIIVFFTSPPSRRSH